MPDAAWLDRICPLPPLPDALPRVVSREQARALGYSRRAIEHRLATDRWRIVLPRVYLTVDTLTEVDRWVAALLFAGPGAALSGAAALRASEVGGIPPPDRILVLVPPPNRTGSAGWVQVRRTFRPIQLVQWHGPARVQVARAAADLALGLSSLDDVRAIVAKVVQQGHCSVADLGAELSAGPRNNSAFLRLALEEVGWGAESAPEARAARLLRRAGIAGFTANAWIRLLDGTWRRVDFYWPRLRAALEMDGKQWHLGPESWEKSLIRDVELGKVGIHGVHLPPSVLRNESRFVTDIREWLAGREADLRRGLGDHLGDDHTPLWLPAS